MVWRKLLLFTQIPTHLLSHLVRILLKYLSPLFLGRFMTDTPWRMSYLRSGKPGANWILCKSELSVHVLNYICIYTMGEKSPYTHTIRTQNQPTSPALLPWPPCSPGLTTPDSSLQGCINGREAAQERLPVATPPKKSCAELWKTPFAPLLHKCSEECHGGRGGASACLSSITVHELIHWPYTT